MPIWRACADWRREGGMPMLDTPRTDSALLDALSVPARQADYPRDSKAFVRIDTSLRVYWHSLFDICPGLLRLSGPDGLAIFRPFMAWADEQRLSLNWTYYLWVDVWLRQSAFRDRLDTDLRYELMAASAARWATSDRSRSPGVVLGAEGLADLVCAWKTRSVDTGRQVERLALEEPLPMSGQDLGYFVLASDTFPDTFPGWQEIPR